MKKIYSANFVSGRECLLKVNGKIKRKKDKFYLNNQLIFSKNDKLQVNVETGVDSFNTYYLVNYIKRYSYGFRIKEFLLNDSSKFILPFILANKVVSLYNVNLINLYVQSHHIKHNPGDLVHVVQRYYPFEYYYDYIKCLKGFDEFHLLNKSEDGRFDIITLKVLDNNIKEAIKLIINGKFLKLDIKFKDRIKEFNNWNKKDNMYRMLYNDPEYRKEYEFELGLKIPENIACRSKPNLKNETWYGKNDTNNTTD